MKTTSRVFKISLSLALMVFMLTMTPASTFLEITKPAEAAPLTSIKISPTNNIVNTRTTYDIFFVTATTGTIKFIQMTFPSSFNVITTTLIERSGIGTGSISTPSANQVIYTVTNPVSVPAGTTIRLQIAKILNSNTEGNFRVAIETQDANNVKIDGPTNSFSFPIKAINGNDVSPGFMIRKTLMDDTAGHAHGWNPDGSDSNFVITDSDASVSSTTSDSVFISVMTRKNFQGICMVTDTQDTHFEVRCNTGPNEGSELHYEITKLPANLVVSSIFSPFDSLQAHK